ncbi:MAG: tetratricopeptide repeat protein [Chitinispirillaceae bacterium]|nr:tetratricopeptide repeat protein [Chitinispirillaceae bacterium]
MTKSLATVLKNRPDSLLFARLADAYRKEGNIGQAIDLCVNGLNNYPYYSTGRILLGRCYLEQQKYGEAIEAFSTVCAADRRNQMAIKMLADIFVQQGMEQRAGDLYALLLKMDPVNPTLKHLCSQYGPSAGGKDIFAILGLQSPSPRADASLSVAGSGMPPAVEEVRPEVVDYTVVEGGGNEPVPPQAGGTDFFPESAYIDESEQPAGVSGTDITDRMSILFGEPTAPPPAEGASEQDFGGDSFSAAEDTGRGDDGVPGTAEVSGTDISSRIEEIFNENAPTAPDGAPETLTDRTTFNRVAPQRTDNVPETGFSGQDFDLSDISVETVQIDRSAREPLHDMVDNRTDTGPEESSGISDSADGVADAVLPLPETGIEPAGLSQDSSMEGGDVSGADVSNRIEELFFDQPPEVKELMPDAHTQFDDNAVIESGVDFSQAEISTVDAIGFGEEQGGQTDGSDFPASVGDQATGIQEMAGSPFELANLPVQAPEEVIEELAGSGKNTGEPIDNTIAESPEAAVEPDLQLEDFPQASEPIDFFMEPPTTQQEAISHPGDEIAGADVSERIEEFFNVPEAPPPEESAKTDRGDDVVVELTGVQEVSVDDTGDQVAGTDVSDRIEELFEAPVPGASEENMQSGLREEEPEFSLTSIEDELQTDHDEIIFEEPSGSTMQTTEELFSAKGTTGETAGKQSEESVFEPDFVSSDFAETMQFDGELFEKMLNPSTQDAQFIEEESPADSAVGEQPALPEHISSVDHSATDAFENFGFLPAGSNDNQAAADQLADQLEEPAVEEPALKGDEQSFNVLAEEPGESAGFEVTTEQLTPEGPGLMIDEGAPSDLVLDHTGTFERETDNQQENNPGLILDVNEIDGSSPVSGGFEERDAVAADLMDDVPVTDRLLSDNTEVVEIAPSGEDVVGQLDLLFPDEAVAERAAGDQHGADREQNNAGAAGESLIAAAPSGGGDEDEAAFIETMQMTRDELPGTAEAAIDEEFFEVQPLDEPAAAPPVHPGMEEQVDGPPVISGKDVKERLDDLFPAPDLMNLSSDSALLPEDDQNEVMEQVSEFYTISGEDALQGMSGELPESIAEVEFDAASAIENAANVDVSPGGLRDADPSLRSGQTIVPPDTDTDTLPEVELYEECEPAAVPSGEENATEPQAAPPDSRDQPLNIPDHVVTPTLADIYYQQGQCQLALQLYRRLLDRDPDNELLAGRLHEIESAIERGSSPEPAVEPQRRSSRTHRRTKGANSVRSSCDTTIDTRPLAGVHLKKQVKYAAQKARKRKP